MNKLEQRVARLEQKRQKPDTSKPSEEEHDAARKRNLVRAKARLNPERWSLPGDTPEQARQDEDIIRRQSKAGDVGNLRGLAEQAREKLRSVGGGQAA